MIKSYLKSCIKLTGLLFKKLLTNYYILLESFIKLLFAIAFFDTFFLLIKKSMSLISFLVNQKRNLAICQLKAQKSGFFKVKAFLFRIRSLS